MRLLSSVLQWIGAAPPPEDRLDRRESRRRRVQRARQIVESDRGHHDQVEKARAALTAVKSAEDDPPLTFEDFLMAINLPEDERDDQENQDDQTGEGENGERQG